VTEDGETARRLFEAIGRLDADAACALAAENYEHHVSPLIPIRLPAQVFKGHEGLRQLIAALAEGWPDFAMTVTAKPLEDGYLVEGHYEAYQGRRDGERVGHQAAFAARMWLDDSGKVRLVRAYPSEAEALAD
jgi:ketosteroid isomerase-like protein